MKRLLLILAGVVLLMAIGAQTVLAQGDWPHYPLDDDHKIVRGDGHYLNLFKILFPWFIFLGWVKSTDWVSQDCIKLKQNYVKWNSVVFFSFVGAFVLLWIIPAFLIGFLLVFLAYTVPLGCYIFFRNSLVDPTERVLTREHLRFLLSRQGKKVGIKIREEKDPSDDGLPVKLSARGGKTQQDDTTNLYKAQQSPGFSLTSELLNDVLSHRAEAVLLDFSKEAVAVRYQIDGVWLDLPAQDRESGDATLAVMKTLAALNPTERRKWQSGFFGAKTEGTQYACRLTSEGTQTGERVVVELDDGQVRFSSLDDLGMRDKMQEQFKEYMLQEKGFILFSSPPKGGLSTTFIIALKSTDRIMRDVVGIEDEGNRQLDIENVQVTTFNGEIGETPATVLPKLLLTYPNVLVVPELEDAESAQTLCSQANGERLVISAVRAKESVEALLRVLLLNVPPGEFARAATAVLNQRLIRKLCDQCKVAYEPTAEVLAKLSLPPGRIEVLYREPKPDEVEDICSECNGIGYLGRTAIFEWLVLEDKVRSVLAKTPKIDPLRKAAQQAGLRTLQAEGILLVARGITSIAELMRVLKQ